MAGAGVTVQGLDELITKTDTIVERAKDLRPVMQQARAYMITNSAPERFATSTDPNGNRWQGHRRSTRRAIARERKGRLGASKILIRSGLLKSSVIRGSAGDSQSMSFSYGSNVEYAAVHQFGINRTVRVSSHTRKRPKKRTKKQVMASVAKSKKTRARNEREKKFISGLHLEEAEKKRAEIRKKKKAKSKKKAVKKSKTGPIRVDAHSRKMDIPKRPFLGFTKEDRELINDLVTDYLLTGEI